MGSGTAGGLERGTLEVAGVGRSYWRAGSPEIPEARGPLLIMLHGSGTTGRDVAATCTGLASRGPAAGVTVVFPDGWRGVWHIARPPPGEPDLDDAAFLAALAGRLAGGPLFLAGLSNGAGFAEHVARHGLLRLDGLFLVAGTLREFSRQAAPVPRQRLAVTIVAGTADPMARYEGGPMRAPGVAGWILRRRAARHGDLPSERRVAATETVARDWASANGIGGEPAGERLPQAPGDPPVTRLSWSAPGCPPVVVYRIEGGGHGWPGGPQYLPARVVGPIPRHLDATGILLDMVTAERDYPPSGEGLSRGAVRFSGMEHVPDGSDESQGRQPATIPARTVSATAAARGPRVRNAFIATTACRDLLRAIVEGRPVAAYPGPGPGRLPETPGSSPTITAPPRPQATYRKARLTSVETRFRPPSR